MRSTKVIMTNWIYLTVISACINTCVCQTLTTTPKQSSSLLPKPGVCGTVKYFDDHKNANSRIGEFPWIAQIANLHYDIYQNRFDCSGALINSNYVLAPGGCIVLGKGFVPKASYVRLGDWDTSTDIDCENGVCSDPPVDIPIEATFTNYDIDWPWVNNIGLIRLAKHVEFTKWISPICLPNLEHSESVKSYVGASFLLGGWNQNTYNMTPEVQLKQNLPVVQDEFCEKIWNVVIGKRLTQRYDRFTNFCVRRNEKPCRGSGTIMAIDYNEINDEPYWYAVGFYGHGPCDGLTICEKVLTQMQWITETIRP